jgi:predicted porin
MFPWPAGSGTPDAAAEVDHYGSMYTMADYETKATNIYLSVTGTPTERLRMTSTLVYNMSTGEYDPVVMPDVTDRLNGELADQDFTFEHMHEYSNLDYSMMQFSLGFEYLLAKGLTFTVDGDYAELTDDAGYVYGDESGSLFMVRSGLRLDF